MFIIVSTISDNLTSKIKDVEKFSNDFASAIVKCIPSINKLDRCGAKLEIYNNEIPVAIVADELIKAGVTSPTIQDIIDINNFRIDMTDEEFKRAYRHEESYYESRR